MKKKLLGRGILKKTLTGLVLAIFVSLFCIQGAKAQTVLVGNNTGTTIYYPLYNYYGYSYSQSIYLASELTTAGASGPAYISAIKYFYASDGTPTSAWNQWSVYMANTGQSSFAGTSSWISGLSPVYTGTINIP